MVKKYKSSKPSMDGDIHRSGFVDRHIVVKSLGLGMRGFFNDLFP